LREETTLQQLHDTGAFSGADAEHEIDARKNDPEDLGESIHSRGGVGGLDEVARVRVPHLTDWIPHFTDWMAMPDGVRVGIRTNLGVLVLLKVF